MSGQVQVNQYLLLRYWIVLSLALLLELLLDQAPILKRSKALYIAYQALKLAFVLWCLAPLPINGAEVNPCITLCDNPYQPLRERLLIF